MVTNLMAETTQMETPTPKELPSFEAPRRAPRSIFYDNYSFVYILSALAGYLISAGLIYMNINTRSVLVDINHGASTPFLFTVTDQIPPEHLWAARAPDSLVVSTTTFFLNRHSVILEWGLFMALLTAFAAAVFLPAAMLAFKIARDFELLRKADRQHWIALAAGFLAIGIGIVISNYTGPLLQISPDILLAKLNVLFKNFAVHHWMSGFVYLVGLLCLLGLFVLNLAVTRRNEMQGDDTMIEPALQAELFRHFYFFAFSMSLLVSLGVLATASLRDVVYSLLQPASPEVAATPEWAALAPASFILYYALKFTILLALLIIPTHSYLIRSSRLALGRIQMKSPEVGTKMETLIGLGQSGRKRFHLGLLILLPVLVIALKALLGVFLLMLR